jgi:hypothetical protein
MTTARIAIIAWGLMFLLVPSAHGSETSEALRSLCGTRAVRFAPLVDREARRSDVDPVLLVAVIRAESTCNPKADSGSNDIGLGQLRLGTLAAAGATLAELIDPSTNLRLTAAWLAKCLSACPTLIGGLSRYRGAGCNDTKGSRRVVRLLEFAKRKILEARRS